jgi:nicotinate-nucleotide adenylyltransferase
LVNNNKETIAIFGGSFDPLHKGHKAIVVQALDRLTISKIVVVPTYLNPFKSSSLISTNKRLEFVRTSLNGIDNVVIDDWEIKSNRSVYTFETVKYLQEKYFVKYIIVGADNIEDLAKWSNFEWLNSNFIWVIASRKGYNISCSFLKKYINLEVNIDISSTQIRDGKKFDEIDENIVDSLREIIDNNKKEK